MNKSKKWSPVVLILVLAIGWNVSCENPERPPYSNCKKSDFLDTILDRILQEVPENYRNDISIYIEFASCDWASFYPHIKSIFINEYLLLIAENEAEIAYNIAHEVGHAISDHSGTHGGGLESGSELKILIEEENTADQIAMKLMEKIGYNTLSAIDILRRMKKENFKLMVDNSGFDIEVLRRNNKNRKKSERAKWLEVERPIFIHKITNMHHKNNQKDWILFTPEDLEEAKDFCRRAKYSKELLKYYKSRVVEVL